MNSIKLSGSIFVTAAMLALIGGGGTASATVFDNESGTMANGSKLTTESDGKVVLDATVGELSCNFSFVTVTLERAGSNTETLSSKITEFTVDFCNLTFHVIRLGTMEVHTFGTGIDTKGRVTLTESEWTTEFLGFHCIFATKNTEIGTLTGSAVTGGKATLDIAATIPRVGGRSGAFCGSSAQWTGSYTITSPSTLNVT
jgi:hypothetical protein